MNKKLILIITTLTLSISLISCSNATKKVVLSENTQKEIFVEESQANEAITTGKKLLVDKKYDEAKAYFNKALTLDKSNKELYTKIKDIYIENDRLDDAYFITKTAIANNIDSENMKLAAKEISSKFEVTTINKSIYQDTLYNLPQDIYFDINGETLSLPLIWNVEKVDTVPGNYTYYGINEEYGRQVILNLTILENVYDTEIGSINKIYDSNGKTYIDVDLVVFYITKELSMQEAFKNNTDVEIIENKEGLFIPDGYYIKNEYNIITTYELSNNCKFQLLEHDLKNIGLPAPDLELSSTPIDTSYENFANYINFANTQDTGDINLDLIDSYTNRGSLCWIKFKNGIVESITRQYTP